ncbi:MAG: HPF/RaiA family ribosome-associated protein [Magnetospirillum sp.]|nr:HPF/RaiA family ribosome-associated protein [Magnetospirillum sp.]
MQIAPQITFRNMSPPMGAEDRIREKIAELERFFPRIMGCRVMVERLHHRHRKGDVFHVRLDVTVPGGELVVSRDPAEHHAHEDVQVAIHDAFDEARRRLEDHARRARADVKVHAVPTHGRIVRLFPYEGYGFIEGPDGREVYFRREALSGADFDDLAIGGEVRFFFHEGEGEKGEQASTVTPVGKHHLPPTDRI